MIGQSSGIAGFVVPADSDAQTSFMLAHLALARIKSLSQQGLDGEDGGNRDGLIPLQTETRLEWQPLGSSGDGLTDLEERLHATPLLIGMQESSGRAQSCRCSACLISGVF